MTACNQCGAPMVPDETAIVPALGCVACGRLIPMTGVKHKPAGSRAQRRRMEKTAARAERRHAHAVERHSQ